MSEPIDQILELPIGLPDEWGRAPLRDVVEFVADGDWVESKDQGGSDFRLLQISNIGTGSFVETGNYRYVTEETFERLRCTEIREGDVLVARMPEPTGRAWFVNELKGRCITAVDVAIVRPLPEMIDGLFLSYFLNTPVNLSRVDGLATGTTRRRVRRADLARLEIPVPRLAEQRAIAGVLGALDDKIESNRRIWRLRQEIAVAYFNLCRSKSEAEIPMNALYRVGLSGVWGEESPTDSSTIETTCLRGRDLEDYMTGSRCAPPTRFITNRQLQARYPELGEIWTAGSGSLGPSLLITESVKKRWDAPITNSNFVKRLVPIGEHIHHAPAFHVVWESWNSGGFSNFRTGTAMPNLDPDALLRGLSVPQLTIEEIMALTDLTEVALDSQLPKETMALSSLRDALLPELLSGRLRVRDAEKVVQGAL